MDSYTVYVHTNKYNGKRYIGTTKQKVQKRWQNGYGYIGTRFGAAIQKYGWDAFKHEILVEGLDKKSAYALEIALIKQYKANDPDFGYNVSEGGASCDLFEPKYGLDHPNHQRVKVINPETGEMLYVFPSQTAAAEALGISRKGITKACMGINITYKGYIFEYLDKNYIKPEHHGRGNYDHASLNKAVLITFPDGTKALYESKNAACKALCVPKNSAWRYLKDGYLDKEGRRWCYA